MYVYDYSFDFGAYGDQIEVTIRGNASANELQNFKAGEVFMSTVKNEVKRISSGAIEILDVIFSNPATIVYWSDKTKTVVKCQSGDEFHKEQGLALAISKKFFGNKGNFNNHFKKWCE